MFTKGNVYGRVIIIYDDTISSKTIVILYDNISSQEKNGSIWNVFLCCSKCSRRISIQVTKNVEMKKSHKMPFYNILHLDRVENVKSKVLWYMRPYVFLFYVFLNSLQYNIKIYSHNLIYWRAEGFSCISSCTQASFFLNLYVILEIISFGIGDMKYEIFNNLWLG